MALFNTLMPYTASIGLVMGAFVCFASHKAQQQSFSYMRVRHRR